MVSDRVIAEKAGIYITHDDSEQTIMVAVALGESRGNERAHNRNAATRDDSYGLWQINMFGDLGPARRRQYRLSSNEQLFDVDVNAEVAGEIYKTQGKTAWGAYTDGRYEQFMDRARTAVEGTSGGGLENPLDTIGAIASDPLGAITGYLGMIVDPIVAAARWIGNPGNWVRILQVAGGIVLGLLAVNIAAKPATDQAMGITKAAAKAKSGGML